MASESPSSSRREFLGTSAFVLAGLATTARLAAADAPKAAVKRPPNPFVYKFNVGKIEAFSISDGHMLFRQGLDLMWPESDRPVMKAVLEFNRERLDALPLYVNVMGLKIGDEVALIDAGFGERHPNPNFGWLAEGLRQLGIKPEQVTTGFLSHSHSDHLDGFVDNGKPAFPNAKIYLLQGSMISGAGRIQTSPSRSATRILYLIWSKPSVATSTSSRINSSSRRTARGSSMTP
jgi:hypothetical protein